MATTVPYAESSRELRAALTSALDTERLKALHEVSGLRHALVVLRQLLVLAAAVYVILRWPDVPWAWVPATITIGFVVFSFLHLLHEVVHRVVFRSHRSRFNRALGLAYATLGGLSASQFERWHLDHHDMLGTADRDPKRAHLTPKIVRRWYKALYLTPALFPIYFRAAAKASAGYEPALRARIRRERLVTTVFHLGLAATLWVTLGPAAAAKLHLLPVFAVFPFAFTVNRLGQHYDVNPDDPAAWSTLMRPSPLFWDRVFLWTNYHLEHHYFPRVPMYRLPALRKALDPFLAARGVRPHTYRGLLWGWFVLNRAPHTDWRVPAEAARP
ncbi:MAG: fatty acid desaturase [Planctomycetia bacterium]|nr:fatty acid desaturase [Planctomycetia bacterium]